MLPLESATVRSAAAARFARSARFARTSCLSAQLPNMALLRADRPHTARSAISASLRGRLLLRESDERVFDVAFSRFVEGQGVTLVSERGRWGKRIESDPSKEARAGREFRVNEDGTVSPFHSPELVLGFSPPKLLLVPPTSPRRLLFTDAALRLFGGERGVRLLSDCGVAVVPVGAPVDAFAGWRYLELAAAESSASADALAVRLEGLAVVSEAHGMSLDVGNLSGSVSEGAAVLLTGGRTLEETLRPAARRSFAFNGDGSLGIVGHPHLVVGLDYELHLHAAPAAAAAQ